MDISRGRCQIKTLIRKIGIRQSELARRSGYTRQMIWAFASDVKKMSPEAMYIISRALGVPMESLYEWVDKGNAE